MVFVKVRETYDLHTIKNRMTVIGVHTPKPIILARNYPGLLMQCRSYRPVSADVRIACASMMPLDPLGIGTAEGDVAPEDVFNPILYKAMSNKGMSQLEARINGLMGIAPADPVDVRGDSANIDVDSFTSAIDEFPIYYGLLANTHEWRHASPQAGLSMTGLKPYVYEQLVNIGDDPGVIAGPQADVGVNADAFNYPGIDSTQAVGSKRHITGSAKPLPFMNCTAYTTDGAANPFQPSEGESLGLPTFREQSIPWINCMVGAIIIPPSRLHELFFRMVVEWTIEFSQIRPFGEVVNFGGLGAIGNASHYQNYSYEATKEAVTGDSSTILDKDSTMVSANVDVNKVM